MRTPPPPRGDAGPLDGIRILDLSRLLPGPLASLVLADLGAAVDKIEDPGAGDYLRQLPPTVGTGESETSPTSSVFLALNRNKRGGIIDLKHPEGRAALRKLLGSYDVLLESFRPGVLDRLGLGHALLRAEHPRLVICALTGYGQDGPLAQRAGHDLNYLARAGVLGLQGPSGSAPTVPGFQLADVSGGLYSVIGIMGALMERARTGQGSIVDIAMIETSMPFALSGFGLLFGGASPLAGGEAITGGIAPYSTYATKDGRYVALGALEPKFWLAFCEGVGRVGDLGDFLPGPHQVALKAELAALFSTRTFDEWVQFARDRECCLEPVLSPEEAMKDEHLRSRKMFFELSSRWGTLPQMRTPLTSRDRTHTPPPDRGEHTEVILRDAGFDEASIARLRASGAIKSS